LHQPVIPAKLARHLSGGAGIQTFSAGIVCIFSAIFNYNWY